MSEQTLVSLQALIAKLRCYGYEGDERWDAADTIEDLLEKVARLEKALKLEKALRMADLAAFRNGP